MIKKKKKKKIGLNQTSEANNHGLCAKKIYEKNRKHKKNIKKLSKFMKIQLKVCTSE
jgi:hypothetical protein